MPYFRSGRRHLLRVLSPIKRTPSNLLTTQKRKTLLNSFNRTAVLYSIGCASVALWHFSGSGPVWRLRLLSDGDEMGVLIPHLGVGLCRRQVQATAFINVACMDCQQIVVRPTLQRPSVLGNFTVVQCHVGLTYSRLSFEPCLLNHLHVEAAHGAGFQCHEFSNCRAA
jgi:hypothetical protein